MTVRDKLNNDEYNTKLPYPSRPKKPVAKPGMSAAELRAVADELDTWDAVEASYKSVLADYNADQARLDAVFRTDLASENNLADFPELADKVFSLAWDKGHSYGLSEVAIYYDDFAELALAGFAAGKASK